MSATSSLLIFFVMGFNFFTDPGQIYHVSSEAATQYVKLLLQSKHGLWWPENSYEERAIKKELVKIGKSECVVIGSSHVMQIGSNRQKPMLSSECRSVLNLGVSGASIEDHFILTYLAVKTGHYKKIILGIDPWTFAYNKDVRWTFFIDDYYKAFREIMKFNHEDIPIFLKKFLNLISLEYTLKSVQIIINKATPQKSTGISPASEVDQAVGGDEPIFLPDGSLVYSAKYIADSKKSNAKISDTTYKTDGDLNQAEAIAAYSQLIRWIMSHNIKPILLMTPYHESAWQTGDGYNYRAMRTTKSIIKNLAQKYKIKVIGDYNPTVVGCTGHEFYDFMHPSVDCLLKVLA